MTVGGNGHGGQLVEDFPDVISGIGQRAIGCHLQCAGIACAPSSGRLPRGLALQAAGRTGHRGSIIVGLNPGRASAKERRALAGPAATYPNWLEYWGTNLRDGHPYFRHLTRFVDAAGLSGPILWTDVAKCESADGHKGIPLSTLRTCSERYLRYEIFAAPEGWALVAVGKEAYYAVAYSQPSRPVIGVPHPTGAWGGAFAKLFDETGLRPAVHHAVERTLTGSVEAVIWLGDVI